MNIYPIIVGLALFTMVCYWRSRDLKAAGRWKFGAIIGCILCIVGAIVAPLLSGEESVQAADHRDAVFEDYALTALVDASLSQVKKRPLRVGIYDGVLATDSGPPINPVYARFKKEQMDLLCKRLNSQDMKCTLIRYKDEPTQEQLQSIFLNYDLMIVTNYMNENFNKSMLEWQQTLAESSDSSNGPTCRFALLFHSYPARVIDPLLEDGTVVTALSRNSKIDGSLKLPQSKEEAIHRRFILLTPADRPAESANR